MDFQLNFRLNDKIYLRDPESSELGREIVKHSIDLIHELGFEHFTFKKLASEIATTEASVYRYFENKHRLLLYILNWYWSYMEYLVMFQLQNMQDPKKKLERIIELLTHELPESSGRFDYSKKHLHQVVIAESSKVYLVKEVDAINKDQLFKPYKDLCARIAALISDFNPGYPYPRSLSSTLIETAHQQAYFSANLPRLTDAKDGKDADYVASYLRDLLFKALR